jgi:hypothetical protein
LDAGLLVYPDDPALLKRRRDVGEEQKVFRVLGQVAALEQQQQRQAALAILEAALKCFPESAALVYATERVRERLAEHEHHKKLVQRLELIHQRIKGKSWEQALTLLESTQEEFPNEPGLANLRREINAGQKRSDCDAIITEVRQYLADEPERAAEILRAGLEVLGPEPELEALREELEAESQYHEDLRMAQMLIGQHQLAEAERLLRSTMGRPEAKALLDLIAQMHAGPEREPFSDWRRNSAGQPPRRQPFGAASEGPIIRLFPPAPGAQTGATLRKRLRFRRLAAGGTASRVHRAAWVRAFGNRSGYRWITCAFIAFLAFSHPSDSAFPTATALVPALPKKITARPALSGVWLVEQTKEYEVFSNGLRIEDTFAVAGEPRLYQLIRRDGSPAPGPERSAPAGVVFHTTESDLAPFEQSENGNLQRIGRGLLISLREKHAYHFLIDRFGRVYRIVNESDVANHAGHSAWADSQWLYLGLNTSFLGIAFEAQMRPIREPANDAQIHAAKVLVEMLRAKYSLPEENCITHAQVSLNPTNNLIGWHTDWGRLFPFAAIGLPNNYLSASPLIEQFGFDYDAGYLKATGPDLWKGLQLAEERVRETAAINRMAPSAYKRSLQNKYRELSALQQRETTEEN